MKNNKKKIVLYFNLEISEGQYIGKFLEKNSKFER